MEILDEKKFIEGFNAGYLISTYEKDSSQALEEIKNSGTNIFLNGLVSGLRFRSISNELNQLDSLRNKSKDIDLQR